MKKADFIALGLDEEAAEQAARAFAAALEGYVPRAELESEREGRQSAQAEAEAAQAELAARQEAHAAALRRAQAEGAVDLALTRAGARNLKMAKAVLDLDLDGAEIEADGSVKGLSERIAALRGAEDSGFLFARDKPAFRGASPAPSGDDEPGESRDFSEMSYDELTAYLESNPDATLN